LNAKLLGQFVRNLESDVLRAGLPDN